jgi:hypothetical protein
MVDRATGRGRRSALRRWVVSGLVIVGVSACGGGGSRPQPTASPAAATACLQTAGSRVVEGSPNPTTGAIAQLLTNGAYIAFYQSTGLAAKAEPAIARTAKALGGSAVRSGSATIDFVGRTLSAATRRTILDCVA